MKLLDEVVLRSQQKMEAAEHEVIDIDSDNEDHVQNSVSLLVISKVLISS
jgi:hypothetical protein